MLWEDAAIFETDPVIMNGYGLRKEFSFFIVRGILHVITFHMKRKESSWEDRRLGGV